MPNLGSQIQYLHDFVQQDETRYFLVGTLDTIYLLNRATGVFEPLNLIPFIGTSSIRWQSAPMNNKLYLVNGVDPIQEFDPPNLLDLSETPVDYLSSMPQTARYIINSVNHLMVAYTAEGGTEFPTRVRWSDIDDPTIWTPNILVNEAGFKDVGEGGDPIKALTSGGMQQVRVYKNNSIHTLTYYGRPTIYSEDRVLANEGLLTPYAIASVNGVDFFVGHRDFYAFSGPRPTPIGTQRVRNAFYGDVDFGSLLEVFAFIHPSLPEVWFVYKAKGSETFNKCLAYNWELQIWFSRNYFPMSALGVYLEQNVNTIEDLVWDWNDPRTLLTWNEKRSGGIKQIIGGDETGELFLHGGVADADGVPLVGTLETGNIRIPSRNVQTRVGRSSFDNKGNFLVRLGSKNNPGDEIVYGDSQLVGVDGLLDDMAVAREYRLKLESAELCSLGEFSIWWHGAGHRP